ncbi:hypothetical protein [Helicobacter canis]|nr:hypothetical protein [Helicobacter canis]
MLEALAAWALGVGQIGWILAGLGVGFVAVVDSSIAEIATIIARA